MYFSHGSSITSENVESKKTWNLQSQYGRKDSGGLKPGYQWGGIVLDLDLDLDLVLSWSEMVLALDELETLRDFMEDEREGVDELEVIVK